MPRGGYRKPSKPAAVSGPGALARRTDGGAGSPDPVRDIMAGSASPEARTTVAQQKRITKMANPVTPLTAPTTYQGRPVTYGAPFGPGLTPNTEVAEPFAYIKKFQTQLDTAAAQPDAPEAFRLFWNYVKSATRQAQG